MNLWLITECQFLWPAMPAKAWSVYLALSKKEYDDGVGRIWADSFFWYVANIDLVDGNNF